MRVPTETEKAWMAGFVDGEGCLTIHKQLRAGRPSPAYRIGISVSNTKPVTLMLFAECYGGSSYEVMESRKDKVGKNWSDAYTWRCSEGIAVQFLTDIYPYLRLKGPQAVLLLEFLRTKNGFSRRPRPGTRTGSAPLSDAEIAHRERIRHEIRILNHKGTYARLQP